ncbi:hypothetical protein ACUN9Y_08450 [Halomonas sp. V046]|uniref:hypothetical protein n=1 Tax=Halomonas sp. V046 TaxID=3459611 RepID=UPI004044086E
MRIQVIVAYRRSSFADNASGGATGGGIRHEDVKPANNAPPEYLIIILLSMGYRNLPATMKSFVEFFSINPGVVAAWLLQIMKMFFTKDACMTV